VKFDDVLPNVGLSFSPWDNHQFYLSYAAGLSAPRTDNLYSVRRQPDGTVGRPTPNSETTDSYDLGWRLNTGRTMASVAVWMIDYTDRIVSSFDPDLGFSVDRNVGDVDMEGFEVQVGQSFGSAVSLTASVGYAKTELLENLSFGPNQFGEEQFLPLAGKELVETPEWTYTLRTDVEVTDNLHFGLQGKKVSERFSTDLNDEVTPGYTVFDLDLTYDFELKGFESVGVQFNVTNLTNEEYFGTISSSTGTNPQCINSATGVTAPCVNSAGVIQTGGVGFFSIGSPRTATLSFNLKF
jgi:iron complex outermembrane receptor protein